MGKDEEAHFFRTVGLQFKMNVASFTNGFVRLWDAAMVSLQTLKGRTNLVEFSADGTLS
jgi:hypothetical protein